MTVDAELPTGDETTVVILGASNISLGWRSLMQSVTARFSQPLHLLTAHGMGRSYLATSQFGWRSAPGILESELWPHMSAGTVGPPVAALVTDLGNDLVYGRSAESLLEGARETIARLLELQPNCRIVVTRPPVQSVESLSWWRYHLFRLGTFPSCRLSLEEAVAATRDLDAGILELEHVQLVAPQHDWFGLDPIHIRRRDRRAAFETYLEAWPAVPAGETPTTAVPLKRPKMEKRWVMGQERIVTQPSSARSGWFVSAW